MASSWMVAPMASVTFSSVSRSDRRWRWPLTRRNCLPASTIPAAHQRPAIWLLDVAGVITTDTDHALGGVGRCVEHGVRERVGGTPQAQHVQGLGHALP